MDLRLLDIHSHLNLHQFDADLDDVVDRMTKKGIGTITVGVDFESSRKAVDIANQFENVWATIGLHPADNRAEGFDEARFEDLLIKNPKVVGVGECGLDYYRLSGLDEIQEKKRQRDVFEQQIVFAKKHNVPLMLHGRPSKGSMDAYKDMLELLASYRSQELRGDVHFFVGDVDVARQFLDLNFTLSCTGVITFARDYDETIRFVPIDRLMAETDAPFAAPEPFRGTRAEPVHVELVVQKLAQIKGETPELMTEKLRKNAKNLFKI